MTERQDCRDSSKFCSEIIHTGNAKANKEGNEQYTRIHIITLSRLAINRTGTKIVIIVRHEINQLFTRTQPHAQVQLTRTHYVRTMLVTGTN